MLCVQAMLDWVYNNQSAHLLNISFTKVTVNSLVKASLCMDISCHLTAEKSTMIQQAISVSLSQLGFMDITDAGKIKVIQK